MNLIRWTPLQDMTVLQDQMNRLFDTTLNTWPAVDSTRGWQPAADIYETDDELVINADLPGLNPKDIDVRVENNVLTIRGERNFERKDDSENFHRVERIYGGFARSFTLSATVDAEKIQASYKDGVLKIRLPKAAQARPRKIEVGVAA